MTDLESAVKAPRTKKTSDLCIEFDRQQLTFRTDVPAMRDFLARAYSAMVVPASKDSLGRLDFLRSGDGYVVKGAREVDYLAPLDLLFDSIKEEVLLHFILARQDLMWMHAGTVERDGKGLLFAGPSGNGKSTLVTLLTERGWRFLSDDIAPIRMDANEVLPFPQTPRRRIDPRRELPPEAIGALKREVITIEPGRVRRTPVELGAIVFPIFRGGERAKLKQASSGDAAFKLIRDCTNFADHRAAAVARAVDMARTIPVYELTYSSGPAAASLLDSLR